MKLTLYHVDAFTDKLFSGNPAAVIPLSEWPGERLMQQIAFENNLSETAFICRSESDVYDFDIRWFTPEVEINLCGHATLAASYVIFNFLDGDKNHITFNSLSGPLKVIQKEGLLEMDFPSWKPVECIDPPVNLKMALGNADIKGIYVNRDLLVELENEEAVQSCVPDFSLVKKTGYKIIITAPGKEADFASRYFAPSAGIDEDPVTGSAHSQLIPFWSHKLDKKKMTAVQLSKRGGKISCELHDERVLMAGTCVFYLKGELEIKNNYD